VQRRRRLQQGASRPWRAHRGLHVDEGSAVILHSHSLFPEPVL
jgi:hypothetical protein